jgi:nicotinate-nucleotide adenylyltransferase
MDASLEELCRIRRLAIMGGTFDPIHFGHLLIAEQAREAERLDAVVFVPNGRPVFDKAHVVTPAEERFNLCAKAIEGNPYFHVSRIEIDRPGPSFTVDTVEHFRTNLPNLDELFFITGADAVLDILTWHEYDRLINTCDFIAATRPGFQLDRIREMLSTDLLNHVRFLSSPGLDISSTDIRRRVKLGESIRYLTPDSVEQRIREAGLYV